MPDVGVIELQIRDDSKEAGRGLSSLAGALERVKGAVDGFSLSAVKREVSGLSSEITSQKGASTVVKNLASLFNAISKYSKIKNFKIDTKPFESLKSAIGDGFKIGTAGTQLNQLREAISGNWGNGSGIESIKKLHEAISDLSVSGDAKKIKDLTVSVKEYGEAAKKVKEGSSASGDWRTAMYGDSGTANVVNATAQWQKMKINLQQFAKKSAIDSKTEQMKMDLDSLVAPAKEGFKQVDAAIEESTKDAKEYKASLDETTKSIGENAKDAVIKEVASSVQFLTERWKNATNEVGTYGSKVTDAVLPKINALSAEEMIVKKNGEMATAVIEHLITRLNAVDKSADKGYGRLFNIMSGVSRGEQSTSSAKDSAKTITDNIKQILETEKALSKVEKVQSKISTVAENSKPIIDLANIPSSGNNGVFANVAEEVEYLKSKLNEAKESLSQWESVYERTRKQIKYNGETTERTNMLGHAEKGFYSSLEEIEKYESALSQLDNYINNYSETVQQATQSVRDQNDAMKDDSGVQVFKSKEEVAKALGISVEEATKRMNELYSMVYKTPSASSAYSSLEDAAKGLGITLEEAQQRVVGMNNAISDSSNTQGQIQQLSDSVGNLFDQSSGQDSFIPTDVFIETYSHIDYLKSKLQDLKADLDMRRKVGLIDADDIDKSVMEIQKLQDEIKKLEDKANESIPTAHKFSDAWKAFGEGIKKTFPSIGGLLKRFAQIAKYRMLRAVLKHITEGFREGVENVYKYSQAVGTSFAPTMDSMASTMAQFKNSIGAAAAPVLQALIPILNSIANAAISVINVLNQLFAILGGKGSWTRALPVATQAFNDTKKAAGGAGGAIKEMLAAFDELTVISSTGGGGGGGGSGLLEDYENMFEEMYAFDEKIRQFVDWLSDNMESIKGIAIAIGAAILGWRLSEAFSKVLPALSKIFGFVATGAVIAITLQLNWLLTNQYLDTGEIGWLFADILTTAVGATVAAALAKKLIGGANTAAYTVAITLTLSAVTGIVALIKNVDVGAFSKESLLTALENALKVGAAAGLLLKTVGGASLGTAIAGGAAAALTVFGVVIGLKASLDPKIELFSPVYLLTAVGSAVLAGFGTFLFTSSLPAAGIAALLTFGALVAIKLFTSSSKIQWGDVHLTERQIENYVEEKMFRIDVKASIERINTTVEATAFNRTELEKEVSALLGNMNLIKLGLADDQDYAEMQKQVDSIVSKVHKMAETDENLAKLTLQFTPSLVGDTEQEQGDWFTSYTEGWDKVDQWFTDKGKELGGYFVTNEIGEIVASKPEMIAAVLDQIAAVASARDKARAGAEAKAELMFGIGDLDQASATAVLEKYKEYVTNLRTALERVATEQLAEQESLVAMLFEIDPNSKEYLEAKEKLEEMTANFVDGVEKDLQNAIGPGRDLILDWIFGNHAKGSISKYNTQLYKIEDIFRNAGLTPEGIKTQLHNILKDNGVSKEEIDVMDFLGFTGWELLSEDLQSKLISYTSLSPETMTAMKEYLGLDINDYLTMSGWETFDEKQKEQFLAALREVFGDEEVNKKIAQKSGETVGKGFTDGLITKLENVRTTTLKAMLQKKYPDEFKYLSEIIKDWDVVVPEIDFDLFDNSMDDLISFVKLSGYDINTIIKNWKFVAPSVSGLNIETSLVAIERIVQTTGLDINTILSNWKLISPHIDEKNIDSSVKSITDTINTNRSNWQTVLSQNMNAPNINISDGWGDNVKESIDVIAKYMQERLEGINPTINVKTVLSAIVNVTANIETAQGKIINTAASGAINILNSINSFAQKLGWYGSGAYDIPNGQIFVAGEDGPELIGTMNGHNTVANQGQIIEGIAAGVAASNEEQNILLREQNNLLRQILQKDTSVRLGASSALGRTVRKSLDMYSMATGEA